jgi:tRNA(His) 5'-end guanylyltransferase
MKDGLGDRIKAHYENRFRYHLPRRGYTIIRVDGKAFHTYTRDCARPFDTMLMEDMDFTAKAMCEQIQGCKLAYVQSDEISLVLTDFDTLQTDAWFDGNIQKMASISAAIATAEFNSYRFHRLVLNARDSQPPDLSHGVARAYFDSRVFHIAEWTEVVNYFRWRQQDAVRNSIHMAAHACHTPEELHGKSSNALQELLFQKGINWNDYPAGAKRGRMVLRRTFVKDVEYVDRRTQELTRAEGVEPKEWKVQPADDWGKSLAVFETHLPRLGS